MVCPDWFPFSAGLAESCYNTCKQFEKHGHSVRVVVAKDKDVDHKDLDVYEVPYAIRLLGRNPITLNLWSKIKKHIEWCDVVCLFSYMYEMNSRIVWYRKLGKFQKPIVQFYRGSLENDSLKSLSLVTQLAKLMYDKTCGRLMFKDVDHVISNSGPTINLIKQLYRVPEKKLSYIKNAIYVNEFPKWKKENKRIVFVGRLVENKGVHLFEKIVKGIPNNWRFSIIGDGPLINVVKSLSKSYKNIEILGKLPHDKCVNVVSKSDINILPTYAEGSPRSVMEASASGVPSISFAVGDVVNTIPKGCGYFIKPFDTDDFCNKLKKLIDNKDLRQKMGTNSLRFSRKEMDWKVVYPEIEKIITKVVKEYK